MPTPTRTRKPTRNELASRLRFTVMRLARQLRQQDGHGDVTPSGASALASLERLGPVTLGRLAAVERVRPPSVTKIVDRLEELGLARREVDPADRRSSLVHLTEDGRLHLVEARGRKTAYLVSRLADLPADDVAKLEAALPVIERLVADDPDRGTRP
jgi:DNA-binding MarR family transcriptional regulator